MNSTLPVQVVTRGLLALLLFVSGAASAYTLSFAPSTQGVALGSTATVEVRIAGIFPGPLPSTDGLGEYDFDVVFDPALIAFKQAADASSLGVAIGLGVDDSQAGRLKVSDFSFEWPDDLLALQIDSMPLFTLVFDSLAVGTSTLLFENITLGDVLGGRRDAIPTNGGITVRAAPLPEPGTLMLLASVGLLCISGRRPRRKNHAELVRRLGRTQRHRLTPPRQGSLSTPKAEGFTTASSEFNVSQSQHSEIAFPRTAARHHESSVSLGQAVKT